MVQPNMSGRAPISMAYVAPKVRRPKGIETPAPPGIDRHIWGIVSAGRSLTTEEVAMIKAGKPIGPPKPRASNNSLKRQVGLGRQAAGYIGGHMLGEIGSGLQTAGYNETGKAVSTAGNIMTSAASGAFVGFQLGGPIGAGIGAIFGTLVTSIMEVITTNAAYVKSIDETIKAAHKLRQTYNKGIDSAFVERREYFSNKYWNDPERINPGDYHLASAALRTRRYELRQAEGAYQQIKDRRDELEREHFNLSSRDQYVWALQMDRTSGTYEKYLSEEDTRYAKELGKLLNELEDAAKNVQKFSRQLEDFEVIYEKIKNAWYEHNFDLWQRQRQGESIASSLGESVDQTSEAVKFENKQKLLDVRLQTILASKASARSKFNDISEMYDLYISDRNIKSNLRDKAIKNAQSLAGSFWMTNASVSQAPFVNFFRQTAANDANKAISDATTALNMQQALADVVGNALAKISESLVRPDMTAVTSIAQYGYGMGERDNGTQRMENYLARQTNLQEQINEKLREGIRSSATYVD